MLIQRFLNSLPTDISRNPVILDVGSYTGEQSCEIAMQFPNAQIFAFEARPQSAELIRTAVAPYSNIEVIESAVHEFDGETEFQRHKSRCKQPVCRKWSPSYSPHSANFNHCVSHAIGYMGQESEDQQL